MVRIARHHRPSRSRSACRPGPCPRRAATSAGAAGASARIRRTRTSRRSTTSACCSSRTSTPACARVDVRDPFNPKEIGYYIPGDHRQDRQALRRHEAPSERCKVAIQTNNVEVDDRGYIYIVDRANTGMHILELTGPARDIADWAGGGEASRPASVAVARFGSSLRASRLHPRFASEADRSTCSRHATWCAGGVPCNHLSVSESK